MIRLGTSDADLKRAAEFLARGELVAVPTETVYGLAADATDPHAVRRIFAAKGRPIDHPLIVHLPGVEAMDQWAAEVPESARRLSRAFWPGPLTLILPRAEQVPNEVTGGQETVGLRVPGHSVTLRLLKLLGRAVAAPSANRFGRISPTTAEHVVSEFQGRDSVAAVIDGGACEVGVESTIVDCTGDHARVLRPGMIGLEQLSQVLGEPPVLANESEGPRTAGRLPSHYAPETRVELVDAGVLQEPDPAAAVLALDGTRDPGGFKAWQSLPAEPGAYARGLYAALRRLDQVGAARILIQHPPRETGWIALHDRLVRAASH
ncbi:L-threonylcarbamoyladenylate synthase [Wenzhouxiangella sp. EGI_FJ10409]|uniref:L-threonylcarbamoyladenylate synthase n=1 Tax=Wenzhouxiangella sp. EGI_FJ10409 TaxID=3243767 RepID=UPI0035D89FDC